MVGMQGMVASLRRRRAFLQSRDDSAEALSRLDWVCDLFSDCVANRPMEIQMISRTFHSRCPGLASMAALGGLMLGCALPHGAAGAAVLQLVTTEFASGNALANPSTFDTDEVFVPASGDITNNISASIGQVLPGGPGYAASSSAGIFGQVGLDMRQSAVPGGSTLRSEVLIASDEFVNLVGGPRSVRSNFIIDGGMFRDLFSASNTIPRARSPDSPTRSR